MKLRSLRVKTGPVVAVAAPVAGGSRDTISDDEFEALLDQLQGKPVAAPVVATPPPRVVKPSPAAAPAPAPAPVAKAEVETIRVETHKLDQLMILIGELVLVRNRLQVAKTEIGSAHV